jgi:hypothetical protein
MAEFKDPHLDLNRIRRFSSEPPAFGRASRNDQGSPGHPAAGCRPTASRSRSACRSAGGNEKALRADCRSNRETRRPAGNRSPTCRRPARPGRHPVRSQKHTDTQSGCPSPTPGSPLVSPGFARCLVPAERRQRVQRPPGNAYHPLSVRNALVTPLTVPMNSVMYPPEASALGGIETHG